MRRNSNINRARKNKNDEFYTQLDDICNELRHYKDKFKGKVVYCNCDDPYESNFFKYFAMNFEAFGLKKLICTCYDDSPYAGNELNLFARCAGWNDNKKAYKIEISEVYDIDGDGVFSLADAKLLVQKEGIVTKLKGNGDFRSAECIELLKESDIVVTNPPFSLFREYIKQLFEYNKKFLIIGNQNAISYKEVFPLIKENKMWLGFGFNGGSASFKVPSTFIVEDYARGSYDPVTELVKFGNCMWFTNIDHNKRHSPIELYKHYSPEEYLKFDNYDAINVDKVSEIPMDYDGVMGVPITFMDKYCPKQFEIIDARDCTDNPILKAKDTMLIKDGSGTINGNATFARICIRRRTTS